MGRSADPSTAAARNIGTFPSKLKENWLAAGRLGAPDENGDSPAPADILRGRERPDWEFVGMKALVTGATGFVGSAVVRALLAAGHSVRALVRPAGNRKNLDGLDIGIVVGDLTDPETLRTACVGCDALFHVAADYRLWIRDPQAMMAANVDGTRNIIR
ncbi:MAG: NAD-dependent epimerase/dehydratase family protein, partial [Rhodospirillales bacterium]|nr:NAD-dependent epimerase/dehydratase family protein [Rhodospirillales bacterium]